MKRFWLLSLFILIFFLVLFLITETLDIPLLSNPTYLKSQQQTLVAAISIVLLVADLFIPVPSSLIMIGNGAVFGVVGGTIISIVGGVGASMIGHHLGKVSKGRINKLVSEEDQIKAERYMHKWGVLAITITRPVPLLSETLSIMAGVANFNRKQMFLASFLGYLPGAFIYAYTGHYALDSGNGFLSFGIVILVAGLFWGVGKWFSQKKVATVKK